VAAVVPLLSFCATNLNTRDRLEPSLSSIAALGGAVEGSYEIVVAEGPSDDGATEWLAAESGRNPRLHVVRHSARNRGYGRRRAFEASHGRWIVPFDTSLLYGVEYGRILARFRVGCRAVRSGLTAPPMAPATLGDVVDVTGRIPDRGVFARRAVLEWNLRVLVTVDIIRRTLPAASGANRLTIPSGFGVPRVALFVMRRGVRFGRFLFEDVQAIDDGVYARHAARQGGGVLVLLPGLDAAGEFDRPRANRANVDRALGEHRIVDEDLEDAVFQLRIGTRELVLSISVRQVVVLLLGLVVPELRLVVLAIDVLVLLELRLVLIVRVAFVRRGVVRGVGMRDVVTGVRAVPDRLRITIAAGVRCVTRATRRPPLADPGRNAGHPAQTMRHIRSRGQSSDHAGGQEGDLASTHRFGLLVPYAPARHGHSQLRSVASAKGPRLTLL